MKLETKDQWSLLTISQVEALLEAMCTHGSDASIDWVNRHIRILSDVKTHPTKILSTGPMTYQDIIFSLDAR